MAGAVLGGGIVTSILAALSASEARLVGRCRADGTAARTWVTAATWLGSGWAYLAAACTLMAVAPSRRPMAAMVVAVVLANAALIAAKRSFRRARPDVSGVPAYFAGDLYSFPSGHATNAFGVATALALAAPAAALPALAVATIIAAGRVARGAHYPTDVVAGGLLGALAAVFGAAAVGF